MKVVGLITEYNPFHNGHLHHIEEAKKVTGADTVIVIMSGDYVQRGVPAIMPKRLRCEMALKCGASAVFELPVCYATGSAELFATGAVSFLDQLGIVDSLCFGSECNDLALLDSIADFLYVEPENYKSALRDGLKRGLSFPSARQRALEKTLPSAKCLEVIKNPNNILGIEYLKALKRLHSSIKPYTIERKGAGYHDTSLQKGYSSASAIRSLLAYSSESIQTESYTSYDNTPLHNILDKLEEQVPKDCLQILKDDHHITYPLYQNDFSLLLKYKLLNKTPKDLIRYMDVSEELANRICNQMEYYFNFKQFSEVLKTKELTQARITRALLHIMLGIKKEQVKTYVKGGIHHYARILGIRKEHAPLLGTLSVSSNVPIIVNPSRTDQISSIGKAMLFQDILASNLYNSVVTDKYKTPYQNEYKQPIIKL